MNPTQPSPYKKFLLPVLIIIALVIIGLLLFLKGGTVDQGASLLTGVNKLGSVTNTVPYPGSKGLPCLVGSTTPQIRVTSPNGGEVYQAGQTITVKWGTCNIPANANLQIMPADMVSSIDFQANGAVSLNDGQEVITLPSTGIISGNRYKIGIWTTSGNPVTSDYSDNLFTINEQPVTLTYVGSSISSQPGTGGNHDQGTWKITYKIMNSGNDDVYIDKSCTQSVSLPGTQDTSFIFETANSSVIFTSPMSCAISSSNAQAMAQSFLVAEGETKTFTTTVSAQPPVAGSYRMRITGIGYSLTDTQGNLLIAPGYPNLLDLKTAYLTLN